MKPERRLLELLQSASQGHSVCVSGENLASTWVACSNYGKGIIYFRNHDLSGLKSIHAETVWFMDTPVPEEVERLGIHMTCIAREPRIIKGNE